MEDAPFIAELKTRVPGIARHWDEYSHIFKEISAPARTVLLPAGEVSQYIYLVREGCLRLWFNDKGKDITFQFFFEHDAVASLESYRFDTPSLFTLETVEPSKLFKAHKNDVAPIFDKFPEAKDYLIEVLVQRFSRYSQLFLSRIRDTPEARYRDLIRTEPRIPNRVPQHYIASYLGITPVSLSRIRSRVWREQS